MNGLDVLKQCERYREDMARLRTSYNLALDAATRVTPTLSGMPGRSGSPTVRPERFALQSDAIERRMSARRAMYALELSEAACLLEMLTQPYLAECIRLRMIENEPIKGVAEKVDRSVDGVRSALRRARLELSAMQSPLGEDMDYADVCGKYRKTQTEPI